MRDIRPQGGQGPTGRGPWMVADGRGWSLRTVDNSFSPVVLLVGIALLARGVIVSSYTLFIAPGHVHAAISGVALLIAFAVLLFLFGGGKSGGSSGK